MGCELLTLISFLVDFRFRQDWNFSDRSLTGLSHLTTLFFFNVVCKLLNYLEKFRLSSSLGFATHG